MKNIIKLLPILLMLFFAGCSDPCKDLNCGSNGTCIEGTCDCDPGYSGTNCEINICDTVDCINGNCDPVTGDCACADGYEGTFCDTEVRAKYLGNYSGDFANCFEGLGFPVPAGLTVLNAVVGADPSDIHNVILTAPNPVLMLGDLVTDPTDNLFLIPTNSTTLDIPNVPLPITITVSGSGKFIDENNIEITLSIIVPFFPAINCTVIMTKG